MKDATAFTGSNMNENQMLSSGWLDANGYRWIRTTGDLELSNSGGIDLASNKVILFVNGNLTFNSNMTRLNVTNASGFLMVVANGNITVSGATAFIDGIYVGNNFSTGNSSTQFSVYGSVIANGTINLQRDLLASNQTTAAETFNYIPAFLLRIPSDFNQRIIRWREVAPGNL